MKITTNIIAVSLQITERGNESIKIILAILLFCVATIALSKFNNSDLFRSVTKNFFRFKLLESNFNDENRIGFAASFLLNINFILSLTICFFLFLYCLLILYLVIDYNLTLFLVVYHLDL